MKKILFMVITIALLTIGTCFASEKVDNYQDVLIQVNGQTFSADEDVETLEKELSGISKIKITMEKTENDLKITNLQKALHSNDYYFIMLKPEWHGDDDEVMIQDGYLIEIK